MYDSTQHRTVFSPRWALVALVSFILMILAGWRMAYKIEQFHEQHPRDIYVFRELNTSEFQFAGRPVRFVHDLSTPNDQHVLLSYGDATERIRVAIPNDDNPVRDKLPGLKPYADWMKVMRMAKATGTTPEDFLAKLDRGEVPDRLVIAIRIPNPGADPATWGNVWKKDWKFDFYELLPDGRIERGERLKYPTTRGIKEPRPGELHENTWQFQAALQTMPQAGQIGPTHNFFGNGITAAGWTLPVAAFTGLLSTIAIVFAFAPRKRVQVT
jgi:hypothetical protein